MSTVSGKEFFGNKPGQVIESASSPAFSIPSKEERKSLFERMRQSVSENLETTRQQTSQAVEAQSKGEQGLLETAGQVTGSTLGFVSRAIGDALVGGVKAITPDAVEEKIKQEFIKSFQNMADSPENDPRLGPIGDVIGAVKAGVQAWENIKETDRSLARDFRAVGQLGGFILDWIGGKAAKEGVETAVKAGKEGVETAVETSIKTGKNLVNDVTQIAGKKIEKVVTRPLPKPVETVLRETPAKQFDDYAEAARKATTNYKNPTPLELVGQRAQSALDTVQRKLKSLGQQKSSVMSRAAVGNKPAGNIALKFRKSLTNYIKGKTAVEGDSKLMRDVLSEAENLGNNPAAKDVDRFIDFAQDRIYTGGRDLTVPVTDETTAQLRRFVGELNENLKSQLPDSYRNLNDKYAKMVDVRNELNVKLGKEGERGGSLMKRVFSPSDARTKQLFEEVRQLTGVDLVNEATIARFVMETVGDARQASLLEQLQLPSSLSKSGMIDFLLEKATSKFNTPEDILRRAREMTMQ